MTDRGEHAARLAAEQAVDRRWRVVLAAIVALVVAFGLVLGVLVLVQRGQISGLRNDVGALRGQVVSLGGTPVAGTPGAQGEQGVPGAPGQNGQSIVGPQGPRGPKGDPGESPPCLEEALACQGKDGRDGMDGADGTNGVDGVDGQPGADGKDGQDGRDGVDGRPPTSWSWTGLDGASHECLRSNTDDANPTYSCSTEPPPSTSDGGGLLSIPTR